MLVDMAGSENIEAAGQTGFEAKMQVCDASDTSSCTSVGSMCSNCTANIGLHARSFCVALHSIVSYCNFKFSFNILPYEFCISGILIYDHILNN